MHCAVEFKFRDMVTLLIAHKANVNAETQGGHTPLHVAAQFGLTAIIVDLINAGANVNVFNKKGTTPLHEAAGNGHKDATLKLIELKACTDLVDKKFSLTPAELAGINGHVGLVEIMKGLITYQQRFIQNVKSILNKGKSGFSINSFEYSFFASLIASLKEIEDADEVYRTVASVLKGESYNRVKESLKYLRESIIGIMKQYNQERNEAHNLQQTVPLSNTQSSSLSKTKMN